MPKITCTISIHQAIIVSLLLIINIFNTAYAWTGSGHRWVAGIAWDNMTPAAQDLVHNLLISGQDIASCEKTIFDNVGNKKNAFIGAASWSDCVRSYPGFGMYHADRYPLCPGLGRSACKTGHCATDSLKQAILDLNDPNVALVTRRRAVKTIIHLVGDLHQPLHVVATGPIDMMIQKSATDKPDRFHGYWDYDVMVGVKEKKKNLFNLIRKHSAAMQKGNWDEWMLETAAQGKQIAYGELLGGENVMCANIKSLTTNQPVLITPEYADSASDLGVIKIAQASVRLALIFNQSAENLKLGASPKNKEIGVLKDTIPQAKQTLGTAEKQEMTEEDGDEKVLQTVKTQQKKPGNIITCNIPGSPDDSFCYTCKSIEDYEQNENGFKTAEASCKTIQGIFAKNSTVSCKMSQVISNDNGNLSCH